MFNGSWALVGYSPYSKWIPIQQQLLHVQRKKYSEIRTDERGTVALVNSFWKYKQEEEDEPKITTVITIQDCHFLALYNWLHAERASQWCFIVSLEELQKCLYSNRHLRHFRMVSNIIVNFYLCFISLCALHFPAVPKCKSFQLHRSSISVWLINRFVQWLNKIIK